MQALADRVEVQRIDVQVPGGRRVDPLQHGAVGVLDVEPDVGAHDVPPLAIAE